MSVGTIDVQDLVQLLKNAELDLIDVREPHEFAAGRITGALNFPLSVFDPGLLGDRAEKKLVFICAAGVRSARAADICARAGFKHLINLRGGMSAWKESGFAVEV